MRTRLAVVVAALALLAGTVSYVWARRAGELVLTGIVTTDDVIVSSEVQGRLQELLAKEGDAVKQGQLLGVIQPQEWKADMAFYADSEQQSAAQVAEATANLRYQEEQTDNQTRQAEANLAAAQVLHMLGHTDAYTAANLKRRKQEVLDFIRFGLFRDPRAPLP